MSTIYNNGSGQNLMAQLAMARDALLAHQVNMNTIGHNVANVNTPGFHRQDTMLGAREGLGGLSGQYGAGVQILGINRAHVSYISRQERADTSDLGQWNSQRDQLMRVEEALNEVGEYGIGSALSAFWNSWEDLANDVDSTAARSEVINKGADLGYSFATTYDSINGQREEINLTLRAEVNQINEIAGRVAGLNDRIMRAAQSGNAPNDLIDDRERLLKQLADKVDISVEYENNGAANVYLGSNELVHRTSHRRLEWQSDNSNTYGKASGTILWQDSGNELVASSGSLNGLITTRDQIGDVLADLDVLADAIRERVNGLHSEGIAADESTGNLFFQGGVSGARSLMVAEEIQSNPSKIAASRVSATGDNSLAHEIHDLQFSTPFGDGLTINGKYETLVSTVGGLAQNADLRAETADAALAQSEELQQQYTGVNLDEEMSSMISAQYAFQAASKVTNAIDEMMNIVINGLT